MKHMHTTSVGLAKAAWLHNETQVPTQTWQLKTQPAKHMYAKDKRGAIRRWLPSLPARPHNALGEATCEKGTIQIFTQGMNEVIFLEKHLFLQKGEPGGCFQNTRNMTQRWDYTVTCALSDLMLDQLWPRNTLTADSALEVEKVWSLILFFLFPKYFVYPWWTFACKPKVDLCVFRKKCALFC